MTTYIHMRVVDGRSLPSTLVGASRNAYVKIKLNGERKTKSSIIKSTLTPQWNFDTTYGVTKGDLAHAFTFEVWDSDMLGRNDFIGAIKFEVDDILEQKTIGSYFELMNKTYEKKTGGEIYVIIAVGTREEIHEEQRKSLLNGVHAKMALRARAHSRSNSAASSFSTSQLASLAATNSSVVAGEVGSPSMSSLTLSGSSSSSSSIGSPGGVPRLVDRHPSLSRMSSLGAPTSPLAPDRRRGHSRGNSLQLPNGLKLQ